MKWLIGGVLVLASSCSLATEDYWSSNGDKKVTKGAPEIKATQVQQSKPVVLPTPGTDTYCMPAVADPQKNDRCNEKHVSRWETAKSG